MLENTKFLELDLFPSSGEGKETPTLLGSLERINSNYWNPVIPSVFQYLEFWTMDKIKVPSDSEYLVF
jgi:hypothetical protein